MAKKAEIESPNIIIPSNIEDIKFVPTKTVLMSDVRFDENNPNVMSKEKHQAFDSVITKYGFAKDPWLNEQQDGTYLVIDGEQGIRQMQYHNVQKFQAKIFHVTYTQVRMLRQIANKLHGEHDKSKDAHEFKSIFDSKKLDEFAKMLGEPIESFQEILEKKFGMRFDKEETEIPEPPVEPISKLGDIYQLGNHRVMCGDATNQKSISKLLVDSKPHAVITDPPYGLGGYAGRSGKFEKMKGDDEDVTKFYAAIDRTIPEIYVWCSWSYLQKSKEIPRDIIVWKKNNFGMGRGYRGQYEICLYFGKFSGSDSDVWEIDKDNVSDYKHPTQKPVALGVRAIKNSTKRGEIILDYYLGSGSTLIACEQTNRICYGMELDPAYVDVIVQRWKNYTGKKAKLLK